jgi:hypothetical protein
VGEEGKAIGALLALCILGLVVQLVPICLCSDSFSLLPCPSISLEVCQGLEYILSFIQTSHFSSHPRHRQPLHSYLIFSGSTATSHHSSCLSSANTADNILHPHPSSHYDTHSSSRSRPRAVGLVRYPSSFASPPRTSDGTEIN